MKSWLRSDSATLALLVLALAAQTPHTAALFHRLAPAADGALAWAGWLHAWAYALALEAGILLFVMRGRTVWAWGFAFASVCVNAGYYYQPGMVWADTLRAALISIMLPVAIARYSHEVAGEEQGQAIEQEQPSIAPVVEQPASIEAPQLASWLQGAAVAEQPQEQEQARYTCLHCSSTFATRQALGAHSRKHRNEQRPRLGLVAD